MSGATTRRRVLALAGLGSVGVAGCSRLDPNERDSSDPLSTMIPTWRGNEPSETVTLQWLADEADAEPERVGLGTDGDGTVATERTDVEAFGDSELTRHRAMLTGLEPETAYGISVDAEETGLSVETAPETVDESLTFAEGGDVGTSDAVPRLHERAASWDPVFGLVGGDLAYADGYDTEKWVAFLEQWNEHMRSGDRLVPLVAAIGDHELRGREFYGAPDDAPLFYSLFDNARRDRAYWALDLGAELSILILDSNHTTEVAGTQTAWLEEALAERADRDHLLVAYHVPAYPSVKPLGDEERGDIRDHWVPLFQEYGVDTAFEHDDHAYKRTHLLSDGEPAPDDGVLYLGDGAWGQEPREVDTPDERPYLAVSESQRHVIRAEISSDGSQRFRAVNPDGDTIDRTTGTTRRAAVRPHASW